MKSLIQKKNSSVMRFLF